MISLDSNILIRLATGDTPEQAAACKYLVDHSLTPEAPGFVSTVAMVELFWTLRRIYRFPVAKTLAFIEVVLRSVNIVVERQELVAAAVQSTRQVGTDFADGLIAMIGEAAGCSHTLTLDEAFASTGAARLLQTAR